MLASCPRCDSSLEVPDSGSYRCEKCGTAFEAFFADPRRQRRSAMAPAPDRDWREVTPPAGWVAAPGVDAAAPGIRPGGACASHPNNPAIDVCDRCGDFICVVCRTFVEGRRYCPNCFEILYSRGSLGFTQRSFTNPNYALALGVVSLCSMVCIGCYGLVSVPTGVIGIVFGIRSLREIARRPDLPGRGLAIGGIVCGSLGLVATLALWGLLLYSILRSAR